MKILFLANLEITIQTSFYHENNDIREHFRKKHSLGLFLRNKRFFRNQSAFEEINVLLSNTTDNTNYLMQKA